MLSAFRDVSLIFLGIQALSIGLIPLAITIALAVGAYKIYKPIKEGLRKLYVYLEIGRSYVDRASRMIAKPFIMVHSTIRMIQTILNHFSVRRNV
jgi:hypothetical protein